MAANRQFSLVRGRSVAVTVLLAITACRPSVSHPVKSETETSPRYDGIWVTLGVRLPNGEFGPVDQDAAAARVTGPNVAIAMPFYGTILPGRMTELPAADLATSRWSVLWEDGTTPDVFLLRDAGPDRVEVWGAGEGIAGSGHEKLVFQREDAARRANYSSQSPRSLMALALLYGMELRDGGAGELEVRSAEVNPALARAVAGRELEVLRLTSPDGYLKRMIVGRWALSDPNNQRMTHSYEFRRDGVATQRVTDTNPIGNALINTFCGDLTYEWRVKGGVITLSLAGAEQDRDGLAMALLRGDSTSYQVLEVTDVSLRVGPPFNHRGGAFGNGSMTGAVLRRSD